MIGENSQQGRAAPVRVLPQNLHQANQVLPVVPVGDEAVIEEGEVRGAVQGREA